MRRVAYICHPHLGGAFTFFQQARLALHARDIDLRCISTASSAELRGTPFDAMEGVDVLHPSDHEAERADRMIVHLLNEGYVSVISLPCCGPFGAALPRYIPDIMGNVLRVPMMSRGAYAPTKAVAPWLSRIVAVSDRVASDLVRDWGLSSSSIDVVYNGVDPSQFPIRPPRKEEPVRLLFAGRLSDLEKGILLLPEVLTILRKRKVEVRLLVAGEGPDSFAFRKAIDEKGLRSMVEEMGPLPLKEVRELMARADIFLLPSRFEGCPNALMEAMAAGCICVASAIRDSVTRIVEDGVSGLLFPPGDAAACAGRIAEALAAPSSWPTMQEAARQRILDRFTLAHMAEGYLRALDPGRARREIRRAPLVADRFSPLRASAPTWRRFVPVPLKVKIRSFMERRGRSI